jgi:hypothetical protein
MAAAEKKTPKQAAKKHIRHRSTQQFRIKWRRKLKFIAVFILREKKIVLHENHFVKIVFVLLNTISILSSEMFFFLLFQGV